MVEGVNKMKFESFATPCMSDLETWVLDNDVHDTLFRMWRKGENEWDVCDYVFITHFIMLPNGEVMIGVQDYNEDTEDLRYPYIAYYLMSEVRLAVSKMDEDKLG